ncbi:MAG: M48 family metallopeptidase [Gammaproteobacteria bacterium]|nr:M48 family metallopeptidase [Gammaproteobacteria bacterium]
MTKSDLEAELRVEWLTMKRGTPHHPSQRVQRYAQCVAFAIIDVLPEEFQNLNWEIIVFDDGRQNAMVTPDGKIAIFSGLLAAADTPSKLAAVIGHEAAHLTEDHVSERLGRMRTTGVLGAVGGTVTGFGGEAQSVAQVFFQLPYQRKQESEADLTGMMYMAKAGYDPSATIDLWRAMGGSGTLQERRQRPPDFLSTHPDPELRMTDIARNLAPALQAYHDALDAGVRPRCSL